MVRQAAKSIFQVEKELDSENTPVDKRKEEKKLVVERAMDGLYVIKWTAGGEVPDELKGRWTNLTRANLAIQNFMSTQEATVG